MYVSLGAALSNFAPSKKSVFTSHVAASIWKES
jgi:hypothetical protein